MRFRNLAIACLAGVLSSNSFASAETYKYDALGRLVSVQSTNGTTIFNYDPAGNRTQINVTSTVSYDLAVAILNGRTYLPDVGDWIGNADSRELYFNDSVGKRGPWGYLVTYYLGRYVAILACVDTARTTNASTPIYWGSIDGDWAPDIRMGYGDGGDIWMTFDTTGPVDYYYEPIGAFVEFRPL